MKLTVKQAAAVLLLLIQFSLHKACADDLSFLLKQAEFEKLQQADQIKYLNTIFKALAEIEQSKKLKTMCVVGGDVFAKTNDNCLREQPCSKYEVACASYLAEHECVNANAKTTTIQCLTLHPVDTKMTQFFTSGQSAGTVRNFAKALAEYCQVSNKPRGCVELEQQVQTYRKSFQIKVPKTSLFNLLRLLFNQAYAASFCTYDKKTQTFYGQDNQVIQFHFASHSQPSSVVEFNEETMDPKVSLYRPAQRLIQRNAANNEEMLKHTLDTYKKLKSGDINWVGFEGSEEFKKKQGGTLGVMSEISLLEQELLQSGLRPSDAQLALINLYGEQYSYYLWFKEQPNPKAAAEKIKLIGIDNGRNPQVDKLNEEVKKSSARETASFKTVGNTPSTFEDKKFISQFYDALTFKESDASVIEGLLKSPNASKITAVLKKAIIDYLTATKNTYRLQKEQTAASEKEFKIRDFSIAQDNFSTVLKNGKGLTTLGTLHEAGTIGYLIQTCRNYRGSNSPSGNSNSNTKVKSAN